MVASEGLREPFAAVAGLSMLFLVVGLLGRWGPVVQAALALAIGQYAGYLLELGEFDSLAPLYAGGIFVAGELAYDALESRGAHGGRVGTIALLGLAAAGVALLFLGVAAASSGGFGVEVAGVAAAAAALAIVARLAWTARER